MDDWDWLSGNARCWRSISKGINEKEDGILEEYDESYKLNGDRYFGERDMGKYSDEIKDFFINRRDRMLTFLKEEFELSGEPVYFVLLSNKENAAEFSVNTITLERSCFYWQGLYFNDYPVTLRINDIDPEEQFLGCYDDGGTLISTEQEITVELGSDTKVVHARFEE